ncbi:flagellar hook-length control protein FliK [uncultured Dechloromonas sp.]|uniref:flagellar hook-length control protein FliK n=1 Tax=uncultured Dechloromonas sp. TaxID=171719 RepID=UPI0025CFDCCE|nr:flagellar hook-length control protein FliK [uncultured Dechloromonas sp.]
MIPPDVASALRLQLPDQARIAAEQPQNQPVASIQRLTDALTDLAPGQRIMAEIQALLPNGTYRAVVAQRNVTLALPFSAKPGDTLELEVAESNGKLTLAFVANRTDSDVAAASPNESVPTTLSPAGRLIGQLIGNKENEGQRAAPAPLNGSQPLVTEMPESGAELAPVLKQALTQSGMFYEAHQARWVAGQLPTETLKQEPQGKLPAVAQLPHAPAPAATTATVGPDGEAQGAPAPSATSPIGASLPATNAPELKAAGSPIPEGVASLVRQQLDGLATNNFVWQGQIWPGQQMQWEIADNPERQGSGELGTEREWQSRLKLSLPSLGSLDVMLRLQPGGKIALSVNADSDGAEDRLRGNIERLQQQLSSAGLELAQIAISHDRGSE